MSGLQYRLDGHASRWGMCPDEQLNIAPKGVPTSVLHTAKLEPRRDMTYKDRYRTPTIQKGTWNSNHSILFRVYPQIIGRSRLARAFVVVMRFVRSCYFHGIGSILSKYTDDNTACTCPGPAVERQTIHGVVSA